MSVPNITREQVDRAEPLEFPQRPARNDLTITVKARVAGFDTEVCYTGSIEQLASLVKRLQELGAEPQTEPPALPVSAPISAPRRAAKVERIEPAYQPDGTPCCPSHRKPLREGQHGDLYCPSKARPGEPMNEKGYCTLRFAS